MNNFDGTDIIMSLVVGILLSFLGMFILIMVNSYAKQSVYNHCEKHGVAYIEGKKLICEVSNGRTN